MWKWLKEGWIGFEAWIARVSPGFKTMIVSALGALGSFAGFAQTYVSNMPLNRFITAEQISVVTFILFTLTFWLRGIGDRVAVRETQASPKALDPNA